MCEGGSNMNYGQYIFGLELNNPNSQIALSAKMTDTGRKLYINLTQDGEPYIITDDCWMLFMATKSDGTKIVHECSVVNNVVEYELQEQTVASIGVMNCAIAVYGNVNNVAKKLESAMFNMVVYNNAIDVDEVISSDDYQAFISATGELKALMAECETLLNTYAAQLSTINNSLKVLAQSNSIDLMQSIPSFQNVEAGVLTCRWELDSKVFTLSSNTTEERNILIGTLDLSHTVLNEQTVNLDIQGANNNVSVRCTLTLHSGATVTNTVVKSEVIELNNSQFKAVKIEVCKASGYRGSSQIKITCETAPTNKELHKQIKLINKQLEEGGGAGEDGKSAYEIWLEQGNTGTEEDFLASLKPVKDEDYFTESDKAELVTDVLEALPAWEGGSF